MAEIFEKQTEKQAVKPPVMWNVIFLNDDFTSFEFVIACLISVFKKSMEEAVRITEEVHHKGKGIAGLYTKDIAITKQQETMAYAKSQEHPLQVVVEPAA